MSTDKADASNGEPEDFDLIEDEADEAEQIEQDEGEDKPDASDADEADDDEEVVIQFGDEAPPASTGKKESSVIRQLREEIRELRKQSKATPAQEEAPVVIDPGPEPTIEDEDVDYDTDKFAAKYKRWVADTQKAADQKAALEKANADRRAEMARTIEAFNQKKAALKVKDFDAAEAEFASVMSPLQAAAVLKATLDPAAFVYAVGKHPAKLKELSETTDITEFTAKVARLETTLKMTRHSRAAPPPEGTVKGSAPLSESGDKHLERLEREADRTGDRTKVIAYKRSLRDKA